MSRLRLSVVSEPVQVVLRGGGAGGPSSEGAGASSIDPVMRIVSVRIIESSAVESAWALRQRAVCR